MVVALTARHWRNLVAMCGIGETIAALQRTLGVDLSDEEARYRYREVLAALMRPWFESQPYEELTSQLDEAQVLWGTYRSIEDLVSDPTSLDAHERPDGRRGPARHRHLPVTPFGAGVRRLGRAAAGAGADRRRAHRRGAGRDARAGRAPARRPARAGRDRRDGTDEQPTTDDPRDPR